MDELKVSERQACRALGIPRSTQRYKAKVADDEPRLMKDIVRLAKQYGRYGYRRITRMLRREGWKKLNRKRVERIWKQEGLKVPQRQPKRRRLWLNDGSCIRLRPERPNHVWSYDFVEGADQRRTEAALPEHHRRVHAGVPVHRRGSAPDLGGRAVPFDRAVHPPRDAGLHPVGQRVGVHSHGGSQLARRPGSGHAFH
jgi:transposase InsO family protein